MPNPEITAKLAELDALYAASTQGEWESDGHDCYTLGISGIEICEAPEACDASMSQWPANSYFIAEAHNAYPAMRQHIATQAARIAELEGKAVKAWKASRMAWQSSPAYETYCDLKHGSFSPILTLLQDGQISRGKAAEALAKLAHGGEPDIPERDYSEAGQIGDYDTPLQVIAALRAEITRLKEQLAAAEERAAKTEGDAQAQIATLREALERIADDGIESSRDPRTLAAKSALAATPEACVKRIQAAALREVTKNMMGDWRSATRMSHDSDYIAAEAARHAAEATGERNP